MRILRYNSHAESVPRVRLGVLVDNDTVGDLQAGYARLLSERMKDPQAAELAAMRIPALMLGFIANGEPAWAAARETLSYLASLKDRASVGLTGEPLFTPLSSTRLHAPIKPSKVIAVGRNYADHLAEVKISLPLAVPSAWIKATSTIIGPTRDVVRPQCVKELDYETELAIVIGRKAKNVPENKAYDVIAGYTSDGLIAKVARPATPRRSCLPIHSA